MSTLTIHQKLGRKRFQKNLPDGSKTTLKTQIVTTSSTKKKSHYTEDPVVINYSTELTVSQVLRLVDNQQTDFSTIFDYELAPLPVPTSMFQNLGEERHSKTESV